MSPGSTLPGKNVSWAGWKWSQRSGGQPARPPGAADRSWKYRRISEKIFFHRGVHTGVTDVNERVREEWQAETTGRERVREVLLETTEPATAGEVAERALVSEPTARKYLTALVESGVATTTREGRTTRYRRDEGHVVDERIRELRETHSRDDLLSGIEEMTERLREFREAYGVEGPEDLAVELAAGDDGWGDVGRWRATRRNLALAKAALQVDEAHRVVEA
jgi:DNA-binding transcriptional ArsR family regulator